MRLISKGMIERPALKYHGEAERRCLLRVVESARVGVGCIGLAVQRGLVFPGAENGRATCPGL